MNIFQCIFSLSAAVGVILLASTKVVAQEYYSLDSEGININYIALIGGYCLRLLVANDDVTSYCQDHFIL